jgi:Ca-activated chloride channel homolog
MLRRLIPCSLILLLVFLFPYFAHAAAGDSPPGLNENIEVDLVDLYLTATNDKGGFVTDLRGDELTVTENGVTQSISAFTNFARDAHEVPLTLVMLIDSSGSMADDVGRVWKIDIAREASMLLLNELKPQEKAMVITFDEAPIYSELTADKGAVMKSLQEARVRFGYTALYDAISEAIDRMNGEYGRKILLICSDGNDNTSKTTLNQVMDKLSRSSDIAVMVLGTVSPVYSVKSPDRVKDFISGRDILNKLADASGGYAFFPSTLKEVEKVRELMRQFLLSQYSLAYTPLNRNRDGSWREIKIKCRRKGVKLRYRNGYFAR